MIGLWYSTMLSRRVALLDAMDRFILELSEEIRLTGASHNTIINRLLTLKNYSLLISIKEKSTEDMFFKEFINGLGKSDTEGQLNYCNTARIRLKNILLEATKERDTKSKLYKMLSFSLGAMITLLIV